MSLRRGSALGIICVLTLVAACGPKRSELLARQSANTEPPAVISAPIVEELSGPGVTDTQVKIGFVVVDQKRLQALLGVDSPDPGDRDAQIRALVTEINQRGGIGGRTVVPVIKVYDALTDSATSEEKLCREFTEDERVFAVVLLGQFQTNARPCYAAKQTLMIDQTLFPVEQVGYDDLAPYLWQPALPEYGELFRGLAQVLIDQKFLDTTATLGVVGIDNEANRRVFDEDLLPILAKSNAQPASVQWIDSTSSATLQAGQNQAVLSLKAAGVDRVIVVGGSRLMAFLLTIAVPQEYFPRYAVTTFDNPDFNVREVPQAMVGAVGISVVPGFDVGDDQLKFPSGPGEQRCLDSLAKGGQTFPARANAREAMLYCDALFLLNEATVGLVGQALTASSFAQGVAGLGDTWVGATNYLERFGPGEFNGASGYRAMVFDTGCTCFVLDAVTKRFTP